MLQPSNSAAEKRPILIVGAGALGAHVAELLVRSGATSLVICDPDRVELSNLHRQISYSESDIGRHKVVALAEKLATISQNVRIDARIERIVPAESEALIASASIVCDATDQGATKFALAAKARALRVPLVHGAATGTIGHVTTLVPDGPCLACLFEGDDMGGSCDAEGILPPVAHAIAAVQAGEIYNWLTGRGKPLVGRLFSYDADLARTRILRYERDPSCSQCFALPT